MIWFIAPKINLFKEIVEDFAENSSDLVLSKCAKNTLEFRYTKEASCASFETYKTPKTSIFESPWVEKLKSRSQKTHSWNNFTSPPAPWSKNSPKINWTWKRVFKVATISKTEQIICFLQAKKRGIVNEKMMTNDSLSFFDEDIKLCALRWIRKD